MNRPQVSDSQPSRPQQTLSPTVRDDKRALRIAVLTALVALAVVIVFNFRAPPDRVPAPDQSTSVPAEGVPGGALNESARREAEVQQGDTPTSSGREGMGAPAGAAPGRNP